MLQLAFRVLSPWLEGGRDLLRHFSITKRGMQLLFALLVACGLLATLAEASVSRLSSSTCTIERLSVPIVQQSWRRLRGGEEADGDDATADDDLDEEDLEPTESSVVEDNPFLGMPGASVGAGGPGLQDLASTLQDPKMLQDALRELQDPAVQQQVKAMMEDPAFQESMKAYMEQIIKDPMFESLKKQTEDMLQQEGFMEQIQKAFAEVGGPGGLAAALGALGGPAAESTVEEPESEK